MVKDGDKIKLNTGEIALISEVLESGVAYIAEIFRKSDEFAVTIDTILHSEIFSVFEEHERPLLNRH
ncbi:MAG: hypothetical protein FWC70_03235 [Defluviitaleaceae bacterium]|nr:hypothetical protein [Defluviitaleaceae bacterium]